MTLNLATILRSSAQKHPKKPALVIGAASITYAQLDGMARQIATALNELAVQDRAKIALLLPNVPQFTAAYFGVLYRGSTVVPLNVLLKADEVTYHLNDSDAEVIFVWESFLAEGQAGFKHANKCKHLIVVPQDPGNNREFNNAHNLNMLLLGVPENVELAVTSPNDTAAILYTSGTTGKPKGAELTHFNLFQNALTRLFPMTTDDTAIAVLPLFHTFAQTIVQNAGLSVGATVVLQPRFQAEESLRLMQEHKVTIFAGVPTMYFALLHHPKAAEYDISSLKFCLSGGSPMPVEVMRAFDAKYNVNILEGYGLSETSPVASFNVLDRPKKPGSIGVPIDFVELRLIDERGNEVKDTETAGEIMIKGVNVMKGYYKNQEATKAVMTDDGWFATGDIAVRDEDGYYTIVDRKKDMVIRGGYNVYPREIEEVLYQHDAIAEAAVIGIPDERLGEELEAVVALKPNMAATEQEIIEFCKAKLAAYKYPRIVKIIPSLPKGPTGKILKRKLRSEDRQG